MEDSLLAQEDASQGLNSIAVVGMAGRFPKATDLNEFWENLRDGVNSIEFIADEDLELSQSDAAIAHNNPNYVKKASTIRDADMFDAEFFGIYPKEAQVMDPQQRLFLETSWQALEDAGYDPETYDGMIGVFGGCYMNTYLLSSIDHSPDFLASLANSFHGGSLNTELGNDKDYMATRVSYKLNLRGPSLTIQTACSTSLVAIAQACQNLLSYQCDMALAGASTVKFPQYRGYLYMDGGMVAPDGLCKTFDARANGTIFGDGVGVVLLKRLDDALADGDSIYAVIKGWGLNNDGGAKVGYTAPSVDGQMEAVALAQALADVDPETISYVEAHGTGTQLGDPIEIDALTRAFRLKTEAKQFCAIGSLKTNIGHLDCAAGVAALIKTSLALTHKQIPPSLNFETPNPRIDFENSPFYVNTALADWDAPFPRRAGMSSFGVGGTNAHVILEEAPEFEGDQSNNQHHLLVLSARSKNALEAMTTNLVEHARNQPALNLADLAYTLQVGRRTFNHSRVVAASNLTEAIALLEANNDSQRVFTHHQVRRNMPVVFMFPGQGSQHINMGRDLYETEPVFKAHVDQCAELLKSSLGFDIRDVLFQDVSTLDDEARQAIDQQANQTSVAQPGIFMISYALAKLWMSNGIMPEAMIGHSVGEFVAACLAEVFSLEEALSLIAARGKLMQDLPTGSMMAVRLAEEALLPLLPNGVEIAAINGPSLCVVSGPTDQVEAFQQQLEDQGVVCRSLHTSHAFHSAMMTPAIEPFAAHIRTMSLQAPKIPILSTVTATWLTDEEAVDPNYWAAHLRHTVRFADGVAAITENAGQVLLEVGPGQTLSTLARQHASTDDKMAILASSAHVRQQISGAIHYLTTLGRLWQAGVAVDWSSLYANERRQRLHLPTYPFERKRFWYDIGQPEKVNEQVKPTTANGSHPVIATSPQSNGSEPYHHQPSPMQTLVQQQLQLMQQQLQIWQTRGGSNTSNK